MLDFLNTSKLFFLLAFAALIYILWAGWEALVGHMWPAGCLLTITVAYCYNESYHCLVIQIILDHLRSAVDVWSCEI